MDKSLDVEVILLWRLVVPWTLTTLLFWSEHATALVLAKNNSTSFLGFEGNQSQSPHVFRLRQLVKSNLILSLQKND